MILGGYLGYHRVSRLHQLSLVWAKQKDTRCVATMTIRILIVFMQLLLDSLAWNDANDTEM